MFFFLIKCVLLLTLALALLGAGRTWQMEHSANQKSFTDGIVPNPLLGLYAGSVPGHTVSWLGKKFLPAQAGNAASGSGVNVFQDGERYPFTTSVGGGLRDTKIQVFKIDYDTPRNPFWLRLILDEIVQVSPGHYLGKLHVRIIPGYPFTLAYFELKK